MLPAVYVGVQEQAISGNSCDYLGKLLYWAQQDGCMYEYKRIYLQEGKCRCKIVPVLKFSTTPWRRMWSVRLTPSIVNLGTGWIWVVSFTSWLLYPQGKNLVSHWTGGWLGRKSLYGRSGEDKNLLSLPRVERRFLGRPALALSLNRLNYPDYLQEDKGKGTR
jgi:hypothetical protein